VLDEPNSNLDEVGERALGVALQKIKETGATVFIISHRPNILSRLDRIMVLNAGTLTMYGARDQVIAELAQQQAKAQGQAQPQAQGQAQPRVAPTAPGEAQSKAVTTASSEVQPRGAAQPSEVQPSA
jgi:ATP-binding cassette subfamily C protein EexD